MKEEFIPQVIDTIAKCGVDRDSIHFELTDSLDRGDYSTNVAFANAGKVGVKPIDLAKKIADTISQNLPASIKKVEIAGPGFINFFLKRDYFSGIVSSLVSNEEYGWNQNLSGQKIMVEYTDPNPFKEFHIGHLMSNAIGESIARLIQTSGATVVRANWQGDVGPHVAKAIWGAMKLGVGSMEKGERGARYWSKAYVVGAKAYEEDETAKKEINEINKKIYDRSDDKVNELYDKGREESLEAFEKIYKRLGTKFDNYFFEGTEGRNGEAIVKDFLKKGVFEESDGAIIFRGENHGLHTRVFVTSNGLPTYETKELGLNTEKFKIYPDLDQSIIITANEQSDYFKVLLKVFSLIRPDIAEKTKHISHGLMRFASGKMSSRKGNVVSGEGLIEEIRSMVREKISDRQFSADEAEDVSDAVAIGAIKYTVLRQAIGGDIVFDSVKSISFEGDSGPYLQYTATRAGAVLEKAGKEGVSVDASVVPEQCFDVERILSRFPEVIARAGQELAPHRVATYLTELAGAFNAFYAKEKIVDTSDPYSPYKVALTKAIKTVMRNGLWVLGIRTLKKM